MRKFRAGCRIFERGSNLGLQAKKGSSFGDNVKKHIVGQKCVCVGGGGLQIPPPICT